MNQPLQNALCVLSLLASWWLSQGKLKKPRISAGLGASALLSTLNAAPVLSHRLFNGPARGVLKRNRVKFHSRERSAVVLL